MIKEGKIGLSEAICLIVISISNRIFFTAPTVVAQHVGTAGWQMTIVSNAVTIFFFTFIYLLLKRFPGKDILEIYNISFGAYLGFILGLIYAGAFLTASGILLREFFEVVKAYLFPTTPISVLLISLLSVVGMSAALGLESIARGAKLFSFMLLFGWLLLIILSFQHFNPSNLFPFWGYGIKKTLYEGISRSSAFSEIIIIAVIAGSLQGIEHIKKIGYLSLIISGLIICISILCMTLIFPYYSLQELTSPFFQLTRLISYGAFFQRLDPIFLLLWGFSTIMSTSLVFYCSLSCYCKTFKLKDNRPSIIPMLIIAIIIILIPRDLSTVVQEYIEILRVYAIINFYLIPLAALIVSIIRKKKGESISA